jgi:hypothetical protein
MGLTCYPDGTVHRFTMCFWTKNYQKCSRKSCCQSGETCGSSMTGLWLTLHIRYKDISPPFTIAGLDRVSQWLVLPGHQTSHQCTSLYAATLKTWFKNCQLILKWILLPLLLRQQQPSGNNLAFLSAHISLCWVIDFVLMSVAIRLNFCSKFVRNATFFRILQWFCLISNLS